MSNSSTITTTGGGGGGGGVHILVFPYPAQGHMIPLLDLTHQLAVRGLTITILITPKNLPILKPLLSSSSSSIKTLVLPFPHHRLIPSGIENVKDLPPSSLRSMIIAMGELYDPLLNWFNSHPSPPIAILSDLFLGWTSRLASHLGIPRIVFSPSPGLSISVIDSLWRDLPKISDGHHSNDDHNNTLIRFPGIPNSPVFPWCHLSPIYRTYRQGDPDSEFIRDCILSNFDSWGIVFNSFRELDSVYQDYMLKKTDHAGDNSGYYDRVWSVGPLLPPDNNDGPTERGGSGSVKTTDLLSWLESCPDHSVVYICFGSQAVLSNEQMEGLAAGLECSETRFLWCVKEPTEGHLVCDYSMVPTGFEDRTAGRGLVLRGWVPQVLILRHRSIGSFLTQCGSNSMLEGLAAGVLILAWPMGADQFSNAKLLVDQLKAAVRVCEGADTVPDATELGRALAESVSGNRPERMRAMELRKAASDAVKEGGSSYMDLDRLVRDLCGLLI